MTSSPLESVWVAKLIISGEGKENDWGLVFGVKKIEFYFAAHRGVRRVKIPTVPFAIVVNNINIQLK